MLVNDLQNRKEEKLSRKKTWQRNASQLRMSVLLQLNINTQNYSNKEKCTYLWQFIKTKKMSLCMCIVLLTCKPPIAIHDKRNMMWNITSTKNVVTNPMYKRLAVFAYPWHFVQLPGFLHLLKIQKQHTPLNEHHCCKSADDYESNQYQIVTKSHEVLSIIS